MLLLRKSYLGLGMMMGMMAGAAAVTAAVLACPQRGQARQTHGAAEGHAPGQPLKTDHPSGKQGLKLNGWTQNGKKVFYFFRALR